MIPEPGTERQDYSSQIFSSFATLSQHSPNFGDAGRFFGIGEAALGPPNAFIEPTLGSLSFSTILAEIAQQETKRFHEVFSPFWGEVEFWLVSRGHERDSSGLRNPAPSRPPKQAHGHVCARDSHVHLTPAFARATGVSALQLRFEAVR